MQLFVFTRTQQFATRRLLVRDVVLLLGGLRLPLFVWCLLQLLPLHVCLCDAVLVLLLLLSVSLLGLLHLLCLRTYLCCLAVLIAVFFGLPRAILLQKLPLQFLAAVVSAVSPGDTQLRVTSGAHTTRGF